MQKILILVVTVLNVISADKISPEDRSRLCFNYYIPKVEEITKTFQQAYSACLQDSNCIRTKTNDAALVKRLALASSATSSCELLNYCNDNITVEKSFECYSVAGSENMKTMREIKLNSTDYLADLQEQYRLIDANEFRCTNETSRTYADDSAAAYADLKKCNLGLIDIPVNSNEYPGSKIV